MKYELIAQKKFEQPNLPFSKTQNWSIALSRRFRSFKLWFVIRTFGVEGIQKYIREVRHTDYRNTEFHPIYIWVER